jgi:hypothetical protein
MEPVWRRENETKFSPRRRPVMIKEDKADEDVLSALANLTLTEETLMTETPKPQEGKNDAGKKPKRTFSDLRPVVQDLLNDCFQKLNLVHTDLDPSIYDSLLDFPDPIQCEIVASFCRADLASIRNKTGYFIGILKQYRKNGKATSSLNSAGYPSPPSFNLPFQYMNAQNAAAYLYPPFGNFFPQYSSFSPYNYGLMQGLPSQLKGQAKGLGALPLSIQIKFRTMFANGDVTEAELDDSIYDSLQDFDEFTQSSILDRFSSTKFSKVRNKTGYFISLLKLARLARATDLGFAEAVAGSFYPSYPQAYGGDMYSVYGQNAFSPASSYLLSPPQANFSPSFSKVCLKAQARLAHLYNTFIIRRTDLEDCVFDSLADFPETDQLRMCDAFAQANLINVRNKTAFFIGILKRHRSHLQSPETSAVS